MIIKIWIVFSLIFLQNSSWKDMLFHFFKKLRTNSRQIYGFMNQLFYTLHEVHNIHKKRSILKLAIIYYSSLLAFSIFWNGMNEICDRIMYIVTVKVPFLYFIVAEKAQRNVQKNFQIWVHIVWHLQVVLSTIFI